MVHWLDQLPSTQDDAHRRAAGGAPHGTAVAARVQTAGRGTRGRTWVSSEGGLWLSVIARPDTGEGLPVLSIRVGLALADHIDGLLRSSPTVRPSDRPTVRLKWPNDLLLDDHKLGGILCEARWQGTRLGWIVVGVGLNVHNPLPGGTDRSAARLADYGFAGEVEPLGAAVTDVVARVTHSATTLSETELAAFAERDWLKGRSLLRPCAGTALGISPNGKLRVAKSDGGITELDDTSSVEVGG